MELAPKLARADEPAPKRYKPPISIKQRELLLKTYHIGNSNTLVDDLAAFAVVVVMWMPTL